jgi:hypothetical protein
MTAVLRAEACALMTPITSLTSSQGEEETSPVAPQWHLQLLQLFRCSLGLYCCVLPYFHYAVAAKS